MSLQGNETFGEGPARIAKEAQSLERPHSSLAVALGPSARHHKATPVLAERPPVADQPLTDICVSRRAACKIVSL